MAKKITTLSQYVFFLGLGVFLIWLSLKGLTNEDRLQITHALEKGRYWLIIPGIAVNILSHWLRALRWRLIIQPLGYSPTKINTFFAVMIGYLANQAVPRLGEVLRCSTLTRYEKIPLDKLVGTVILERLVDTICLFAVFILALAIQPDLYQNILATFFPAKQESNSPGLLFYIGLALLAVMVLTFLWMLIAKKKFSDLVAAFKKISLHIWQGFISIRALKRRWAFVFLSISIWALYAASVYIGFLMLEETMQYGLKEALTVLCAGTLAMAATPGGIGAYAFLVQKTMTIYQLSTGLGLALGWLLWLLQVVVVVVVGGLSLIGLPVYNKNRQNLSE
ncbi:lysylphosphatidylglycerol synthase transmembrane domain-containing protein [Niabella sp. CJ426]|uniref:lysylphosphatidylglycerol synthase transmembrane domain-containing protein n=1 Tax=Niabella sp. CJ426 TaxID=3393740 RepID=UPI003D01C12E